MSALPETGTLQFPMLTVTSAPLIDPARERQQISVPAGATIAQIIAIAMPGLTDNGLDRLRVTLVTQSGTAVVPRRHWHRVRPHAGVHVVLRLAPGKDVLRQILQIVVTIAAAALGQFWVAPLFGTLGGALATAAFTALGSLLINALIPPADPNKDAEKPSFQISGFRNRFNPDGPVPMVLGRHRYAPPYAATTWTEVVDDLQYVRALFCLGFGPVEISDLKIGDTPFGKFDEIEHEFRPGLPGDADLTLYNRQIVEESHGALLERPLPRNDFGDVVPGAAIDSPVTRFTAGDAWRLGVILFFPAGLLSIDKKGRRVTREVSISVRWRLNGLGDWSALETLTISSRKQEAFYRQFFFSLPTRGRYEVEVNRVTAEVDSNTVSDRVILAALQTIRPEYPLAMSAPVALLAVRVKATYQLNGALDNVNAVISAVCPDWDQATGTWITRATRNPASLFRWVLQSPAAQFPLADEGLDLDALADWHAFCAARDLKYDRVHDFGASLYDTLTAVAAAGRASPRHDGSRWSVIIDRVSDLVIDHLSPRNARDLRWSRTYLSPPDAFRVPFLDQSNDWSSAERIIPRPGHTGDILVTEQLDLPGKTDPDEIWLEAFRRWQELEYRPDLFTVIQDGAARVAVRGDRVQAAFDTLDETHFAARVTAIRQTADGANILSLDDAFTPREGVAYGCRFLVIGEDEGGATQRSDVVPITVTGGVETQAIVLPSWAAAPAPGHIVFVGPISGGSQSLIVARVEPGEQSAHVLTLVAAAPEIDAAVDAATPPLWIGRVGAEADANTTVPGAPVWAAIVSGLDATGSADHIRVLLRSGPGPALIIAQFEIDHRVTGTTPWTTITVAASEGGALITPYSAGNSIDLRARAISIDGVMSASGPVQTIVIGSADAPAPSALVAPSVQASLGHALVTATIGPNTDELRIYRKAGSTGDLDESADLKFTLPVTSGTTAQLVDGDGTRVNLYSDGAFDVPGAHTVTGNFTITGGEARHTAGAASLVSQAETLTAGAVYRWRVTLRSRTAGSFRVGLLGGTAQFGAWIGTNSTVSGQLTAVSGNNAIGLQAESGFAGNCDDLVFFEQTSACLPQGAARWWLQPFNDGVPGPLAGPFTATII
jgi:hypothetical protein